MHKLVTALVLIVLLPVAAQADVSFARKKELLNMLKQDCGSCHGLTLKGGLGPALTPEALKDRPRQVTLSTILNGRPGTPMPPWSPIMTRQEAQWMVHILYEGNTDAP
jgi:cytochrome c55X